jgi:hypothetical protein
MKLVLLGVSVLIALAAMAFLNLWRLGGPYMLLDGDHPGVMTSRTASPPKKTISVLFVGGSLTYVNDIPAMLANIASSDPGATTVLKVKAITAPNATLEQMRTNSDAVAYAHANHIDYVILQPHSSWYHDDGGYQAELREVSNWQLALQDTGGTPVLFEDWGDENGSAVFTNPDDPDDAKKDAELSKANTARAAATLQLGVVPIGDAFYRALGSGAPEVYRSDHHHASLAGGYLAALVCYHWLTGRPVDVTTYRPHGLSQPDAAALMRVASPGTA